MGHRALITGVSGFVGGFLAEHLLDCGDAVLGCSPDGRWEENSPDGLRERVELLAWDLGPAGSIGGATRRRMEQFAPDCIYHLAGLSVVEDCGQQEPTPEAMAINVGGTRQVMDLAASLDSRPRVLLASSSHVYAPTSSEDPRVGEDAPLEPRSAYGRTKLLAEGEVRRAIEQRGCDALIVRGFQHAGPRQAARMMLSQWARQFAVGSAPVEVYTLDAHLDLSDVRDAVRAYRLLIQRGSAGEVYNVGSGVNRQSGEILELLRNMADPARPIVELQPGLKQDPIADTTRILQCTGWRATIPLGTTVSDTLSWWRQRVEMPGHRVSSFRAKGSES